MITPYRTIYCGGLARWNSSFSLSLYLSLSLSGGKSRQVGMGRGQNHLSLAWMLRIYSFFYRVLHHLWWDEMYFNKGFSVVWAKVSGQKLCKRKWNACKSDLVFYSPVIFLAATSWKEILSYLKSINQKQVEAC